MNKIYQRIDWENYPSSATPLNEDNLNKMDYAIDKLDDRIVTHETTKLNTATGNTLVKNVTFNEKTGVFTIEKLNGSKITINTALEKISTNFHFNPTTQKLVLTLIDGTVQEIDLSALITQYDFIESDTITFEIDANGKVKANILNGSITGEKLEPNYLANVTLQAKNAKKSADNAKTSEELAYQYAEEAKESASQTAKSDAKNITYDNTESGLSATNVKDALDEVAQGSVSAIAIDTTITDSTNAPLVSLKVKGYTEQQTYSGKNLCDNNNFTLTAGTGTEQSNYVYQKINIADKLKSDTTYILSADVKIIAGTPIKISIGLFNDGLTSGSEIVREGAITNNHVEVAIGLGSNASDFYYLLIYAGIQGSTAGNSIEFSNVMFRESTTDATYEPYVGGTASPNPDYPQEINGLAKGGAIEVKTCRKNMLKNIAATKTINGVTFTVNDDKSITANGTATAGVIINVGIFKPKPNKTYIFTANSKTLSNSEYWKAYSYIVNIDGVNTWRSDSPNNNYSYEFTPLTDTTVYNNIYIESGMTVNNLKFYPMIRPAEITDDTYEPYQGETTAAIPTDAPLYEGDYIEVYADGSGKLVRVMKSYVFDGDEGFVNQSEYNTDEGFLMAISTTFGKGVTDRKLWCDHFKPVYNAQSGGVAGTCSFYPFATFSNYLYFNVPYSLIDIDPTSTEEEKANAFKAWLTENPTKVVYELVTPTETPLTAEQVAEFKKLYTFEPVTNVLCDGETEIQYYKNTDSGETVAMVSKKADNSVSKSSIANNLTTTTEGMVLDATQGKALNDKISTLNSNLEWKTLTHNSASVTRISGDIFVNIITNSDKIKNANEVIVTFSHGGRETYIKLQRIPNVDVSANCATYIQSIDLIICVECIARWSTGLVAISCVANSLGLEVMPISVKANTIVYR